MTTTPRRIEYMCPHCGWRFDAELAYDNCGLVPRHAFPETPVGGRLCPGSEQAPRNPESDRRPLWKDTPPDGPFLNLPPADPADVETYRKAYVHVDSVLEQVKAERDRLRAGLEMIAQIRHVTGSAQSSFRFNLRVADAVLAGADVRDLATVEAIAQGKWKQGEK